MVQLGLTEQLQVHLVEVLPLRKLAPVPLYRPAGSFRDTPAFIAMACRSRNRNFKPVAIGLIGPPIKDNFTFSMA